MLIHSRLLNIPDHPQHRLRLEPSMKDAIMGSGKIGTPLARVFARKNIEVAIANSRGPETLASLAKEVGPGIVPKSVLAASGAEIIFLAVPFSAHNDLAAQLPHWNGKIIVDVTNAFHAAPEELAGRLSSERVAEASTGARVVKAFNHLPATQLGTNPSIEGSGRSADQGGGTKSHLYRSHSRS